MYLSNSIDGLVHKSSSATFTACNFFISLESRAVQRCATVIGCAAPAVAVVAAAFHTGK